MRPPLQILPAGRRRTRIYSCNTYARMKRLRFLPPLPQACVAGESALQVGLVHMRLEMILVALTAVPDYARMLRNILPDMSDCMQQEIYDCSIIVVQQQAQPGTVLRQTAVDCAACREISGEQRLHPSIGNRILRQTMVQIGQAVDVPICQQIQLSFVSEYHTPDQYRRDTRK